MQIDVKILLEKWDCTNITENNNKHFLNKESNQLFLIYF